MRQAARAYFETQVTTTSQGQILIMLYDGAIKFLTQAKEKIDAKDYVAKGNLISGAIDVINELASSLNAEKGGDLAANLSELYFYCNKRLFMANSRMDKNMLDEVIKILSGIRSAYAQIIDTPEAQAAMAGAAPPAGKPLRSPAGMGAGPAGTAVPAAKAHNAYASMGATSMAAEAAAPRAPANPLGENVPAVTPEEPSATPEVVAAPPLPPEVPAPENTPFIHPAKKISASNLYRKFTS